MKKANIIAPAGALRKRTPLAHSAALTLVAAVCWSCSATSGANDSANHWSEDQFIAPADTPQGVQPQEAREPASPDAQGTLAARSFAASGIIWKRWSKGDATVVLAPHRTHICALSMIQGEFVNSTIVSITKSADFWVMNGLHPGSNTLKVDAVCVPLSGFRVDTGTATVGSVVSVSNSFNNRTVSANLPAFTAPILQLVQGASNGFGEQKFVSLGSPPAVNIKNGTAQPPHTASAVPLSFGVQRQPLYDQDFSAENSPTRIELCTSCGLDSLTTSFCYLSGIGGNLDGGGEWAQVYPDFATGRWRWGINSGAGLGSTGSVRAQITCLHHDQSTNIVNPPR